MYISTCIVNISMLYARLFTKRLGYKDKTTQEEEVLRYKADEGDEEVNNV